MEDWTEKYRPSSLDAVVGNDRAISDLRKWADSWRKGVPKKPAVILSGKPGTGKTSSALALANDYGWTSIELNTSDARNATIIKNVATSGAVNETFDDQGRFISSRSGGRKLIVLDEADNLYERVEGSSDSENDFSDKGGKKAIVDTVRVTSQPIILIVNDYYSLIKGSGEALKDTCKLIRFYNPYSSHVFNFLRKICADEGISVDQKVLHTISDRCKGDIRSAVNDLQSICLDKKHVDVQALGVLGYRDREKIIFDAMREIFKTRNIQTIRESMTYLDEDPNSVILWINENLPKEYIDLNDLNQGYGALSSADVFLGRVHRRQNYRLWAYASDVMNGGVAVAKTHNYSNEKYDFPLWLRQSKASKPTRDTRDLIIKKINEACHNSSKKSKDFLLTHFIHMFRNDVVFARKMRQRFNLSENEVKYLLGKEYSNKLKDIFESEAPVVKPFEKKVIQSVEEEKKDSVQRSLF